MSENSQTRTQDEKKGPVLVLGASGLFGFVFQRSRPETVPVCNTHAGFSICSGWKRVDFEDVSGVSALIQEVKPSVLVHAAGVCDVDRCEADPSWAWRINVGGTQGLLECLDPDIFLVYVSSDHVFGVGGADPLFEDSPTNPLSVYGKTRVACEDLVRKRGQNHLCIRVPLLIGESVSGRSGHRDWLRYRARRGLPLTVVADECRHAIWSEAAVKWVWKALDKGISGTRHLCAQGPVDRPTLARELLAAEGIQAELRVETREQQIAPHLGRIDLRSRFAGELGLEMPLSGPMDRQNPE